MSEAGIKIRQKRLELGISQETLAEGIGTSQATIDKIEHGRSRNSRFLLRAGAFLGIAPHELDPAFDVAPVAIPREALVGQKDVPVYGTVEGGPGAIVIGSDPVMHVERPWPLLGVSGGYALIVTGESMIPAYRPGDVALVNPHLPPIPDEEVVLIGTDAGNKSRAMLKTFLRRTPDKWRLWQWNPPEGQDREFTVPVAEWQQAHRVVGKFARR